MKNNWGQHYQPRGPSHTVERALSTECSKRSTSGESIVRPQPEKPANMLQLQRKPHPETAISHFKISATNLPSPKMRHQALPSANETHLREAHLAISKLNHPHKPMCQLSSGTPCPNHLS